MFCEQMGLLRRPMAHRRAPVRMPDRFLHGLLPKQGVHALTRHGIRTSHVCCGLCGAQQLVAGLPRLLTGPWP